MVWGEGVFVNVVSSFLARDLALKDVKTKQVFFHYSFILCDFRTLSVPFVEKILFYRIDNKDAIERMRPSTIRSLQKRLLHWNSFLYRWH